MLGTLHADYTPYLRCNVQMTVMQEWPSPLLGAQTRANAFAAFGITDFVCGAAAFGERLLWVVSRR
jgi:hypothetical protein